MNPSGWLRPCSNPTLGRALTAPTHKSWGFLDLPELLLTVPSTPVPSSQPPSFSTSNLAPQSPRLDLFSSLFSWAMTLRSLANGVWRGERASAQCQVLGPHPTKSPSR